MGKKMEPQKGEGLPINLILNVHRRGDGTVLLAICDKDVHGKTFREGKLKLDLSGSFYNGEETPLTRIKELMPVATHLNLAGKQAVSLGVESDYIQGEHVLFIDGIPYAECVNFRE